MVTYKQPLENPLQFLKELRLSMKNQTKKCPLIIKKKKKPENPELTLIIKHNSFRKKLIELKR